VRGGIGGDEQGAGGREQLARAVSVDGNAGQQAQRGRRRHRVLAVGDLHRARSDVQGRGHEAIDVEPAEPDHRAHHVHDRVHGPDLVEGDVLDIGAVDGGFGLAEPLEQLGRAVFHPCLEAAAIDQLEDVAQSAVGMLMRMVMGMVMRVIVIVAMRVIVRMNVLCGRLGNGDVHVYVHVHGHVHGFRGIGLPLHDHVHLRRLHSCALDLARLQAVRVQAQLGQLGAKAVERQPEVDERAQHHVAGSSRRAVEVGHAAHSRPRSLRLT
jgi:hypothetical protein